MAKNGAPVGAGLDLIRHPVEGREAVIAGRSPEWSMPAETGPGGRRFARPAQAAVAARSTGAHDAPAGSDRAAGLTSLRAVVAVPARTPS
ncbi:hypothetical protein FHR81_004664 [Actinoalloteichus hoggarensis]|uniref:Uncharacterized protein n=1 Tax=Actinoalloteichus hoggarensis TaxID=1470176 RepID=A0A221W4B9_9PSEU|nr:hypothetical protein [Actinoalloteichus hoggarensis]ASO20553.1 hypothetical protein AHOG_14555 [Actinoalloteichus hoggarensis]MBB5923593.1 hypothetical protein [Actinoalloteichus hoggarensis]